jgi:hypothetical protein
MNVYVVVGILPGEPDFHLPAPCFVAAGDLSGPDCARRKSTREIKGCNRRVFYETCI